MKFFTVFAAVLAVACAQPYVWTLENISQALASPLTSLSMKPILNQALDICMDHIFEGHGYTPAGITTAPEVAAKLTLAELDAALSDESVDPVFRPYLVDALNHMMSAMFSGEAMESIEVFLPALELSFWTLQEINAALDDPNTSPTLKPLLMHALDQIMAAIFDGLEVTGVVVASPIEVTSVDVAPVIVSPPASTPSSHSLVQIVLNVKQSKAPANVIAPPPSAIVYPTPAFPVLGAFARKN